MWVYLLIAALVAVLLVAYRAGARPVDPTNLEFLCSQCFQTFPPTKIHIIPWFNDAAGDYFTSIRCDADWLTSLAETRAHFLASLEQPGDRAHFVAFFQRHQVTLQSADLERYRRDGLLLLDQIERGELRLSP